MTLLGKFIRNAMERYLKRFYEGPLPPVGRYADMISDFESIEDPRCPTIVAWREFAMRMAAMAYREGYVRGFECSEREDQPWKQPGVTLEEIADYEMPGWRDR